MPPNNEISTETLAESEVSSAKLVLDSQRSGMENSVVTATEPEWWQSASARPELEDCLRKVNEVDDAAAPVTAFSGYSQALNLLWSGKRRFDNQRSLSDSQAIRNVFLSIPRHRQEELCDASETQALADLTPPILNVRCLRTSEHYIPGETIPKPLERDAASEHRSFADALRGWRNQREEDARIQTLKKLADLLFVVRSNIAHGEKTIMGPDLAKAARDRQVCEAALPCIRTIVNLLFNHPDQRLIAYGTLKPTEPNHRVLESLTDQEWLDVDIEGRLTDREGGLKGFRWLESRTRHTALLLKSSQLPSFWPKLDAFEGGGYRRILATARIGEHAVVAMVYEDSGS
jgi:gamma-glutamylcyclotransferase (GGCT)/AIG2-like uncharacterized protein YtfP